MSKTRKNVQTCKTHFCPIHVDNRKKNMRKFTAKLARRIKNKTKRRIFINDVKNNYVTRDKEFTKQCEKIYCNPTCKETMFQSGHGIPPRLENELRQTSDATANVIKQMRRKMFGKRTNVLRNGFYERLRDKDVDKARANGAQSGCTISITK
jgi:hypothetical protein